MAFIKRFHSVLFVLLFSVTLHSQDFGKYSIKRLSETEGLSDNGQWAYRVILEDRFGFIWIATLNGLNKYDGYGIQQYLGSSENDRLRLAFQDITSICEDSIGNIFIGGQKGGILLYDRKLDHISPFKPLLETGEPLALGQINSLFATNTHLYISAPFNGNFKYNFSNKKITKLHLESNLKYDPHIYEFFLSKKNEIIILSTAGIYKEIDGEVQPLLLDVNYNFRNFIEVFDNKCLVNSYMNVPSLLVDLDSGEKRPFNPEDQNFSEAHFLDNEDFLWDFKTNGKIIVTKLSKQNIRDFTLQKQNISDDSLHNMRDMIQDPHGDLYFMSAAFGANKVSIYTDAFDFVKDPNYSDFNVHNGNLYYWDFSDAYDLNGKESTPLNIQYNREGFSVNLIYKMKDGTFWGNYCKFPLCYLVHFDKDGKFIYESRTRRVGQLKEFSDGFLYKDVESFDSPTQFNYVARIVEQISGEKYEDLGVSDFIELANEEIWIATFNDGIYRINKKANTLEKLPSDINGNDLFLSNSSKFLFETQNGEVISYADVGISIWDPITEKCSYLLANDGLNVKDVVGINQDQSGLIWFLCKKELSSFNLLTREIRTFRIPKEYYPRINRLNGYSSRICRAKDKLYYAGHYGIVSFKPQELQNQKIPTDVLVTDIFIDRSKVFPKDQTEILDSAIVYQKSFTLNYDQRNVGFSFVAVNGNDINATYQYKLSGIQDNWKSLNQERTIHFTNLAADTYEFQVVAKSGAGKLSENITTIKFEINPPWYQTTWAKLLWIALIGLLIYGFIRYRIENAISKLKAIERMRTKISSDLHDDVGTILAGVAMQSELLALNPANEDREELLELTGDTRSAMEKMRDIVWALDSRKDRFENLVDRMNYFADSLFSNSKFNYQIKLSNLEGTKKIKPDIRQNLYLIFKEALTNIKKHSNGDKVIVELYNQEKALHFSIWDNGTVQQTIKSDGLGLSNIKMRAKNINAKLELNQENGFSIKLILINRK